MWRGRISIFPTSELFLKIFRHLIFAIDLHHLKDFRKQEAHGNLAMHLFVRICEGNCKITRTKYRVSLKLADLMRISSHFFLL